MTHPPTAPDVLPFHSRIRRASDGRLGTVTGYDAQLRMVITWDRALIPERRTYTLTDLHDRGDRTYPAVTHCSGCGNIVDDHEIDDSYTTCCNEGACSSCAPVDGFYQPCGTPVARDDVDSA